MHHAQVTVIADSISNYNNRLTTLLCRYWRGIHSELMTHRKLSKSAGSSRARPSAAIIQQVRDDPWGPLHWGQNQSGMQAAAEVVDVAGAQDLWRWAARRAADSAKDLLDIGLHKQVVNRPLEPYTFIDVVITGTDFNNFEVLRDDDAADPTMRDLAVSIKAARAGSTPKLLNAGEWHLPFILPEDHDAAAQFLQNTSPAQIQKLLRKISTARCARTSYKAFDGNVASIEDDLALYKKLVGSQPIHASPAEHQGTPDLKWKDGSWRFPEKHGNLTGWIQNRKLLPNEYVPG